MAYNPKEYTDYNYVVKLKPIITHLIKNHNWSDHFLGHPSTISLTRQYFQSQRGAEWSENPPPFPVRVDRSCRGTANDAFTEERRKFPAGGWTNPFINICNRQKLGWTSNIYETTTKSPWFIQKMSEYHIPPSPITFFILFYIRRKSAASIDSMESCLSTTRFCWSFLNELFFIPVLLLLLNYQPFFLDLLVNDAWSPRNTFTLKGGEFNGDESHGIRIR